MDHYVAIEKIKISKKKKKRKKERKDKDLYLLPGGNVHDKSLGEKKASYSIVWKVRVHLLKTEQNKILFIYGLP